jgi:hypothetical protein
MNRGSRRFLVPELGFAVPTPGLPSWPSAEDSCPVKSAGTGLRPAAEDPGPAFGVKSAAPMFL